MYNNGEVAYSNISRLWRVDVSHHGWTNLISSHIYLTFEDTFEDTSEDTFMDISFIHLRIRLWIHPSYIKYSFMDIYSSTSTEVNENVQMW